MSVEDTSTGPDEYDKYYGAQGFCSDEDWRKCMARLREPLPPCIRFQCSRDEQLILRQLLAKWLPEDVPWCPDALRLLSPEAFSEEGVYTDELIRVFQPAEHAGRLCRQESMSMLPVFAMKVLPSHRVLDMCAAPGSKTLQILAAMTPAGGDLVAPGLLVANDMKQIRLRRMIDRLASVPTAPLLITCEDARSYRDLYLEGGAKLLFDRVLCDAECSGDGTVRKNRALWSQWSPARALPHHQTQIEIMLRGVEMLAPGGILAYSTCALNPVECEACVAAVLTRCGGSVETIDIDVPKLQLAHGLVTWRVPGSLPGGASYASWEEVPEEERQRQKIQRSMFAPTASQAASEDLAAQLRRCRRLLACHDNGGCFFVALLQRKQGAAARVKRGDLVLVKKNGKQAEVRQILHKGPWLGHVRVQYADGTNYHVLPDDFEAVSVGVVPAAPPPAADAQSYSVDFCGSPLGPPLLRPATEDAWAAVADFYGLCSQQRGELAAFPRALLVEGLGRAGSSGNSTLRLAPEILCRVSCAPYPRAAGMTVFFKAGVKKPSEQDEASTPKAVHRYFPEFVGDVRVIEAQAEDGTFKIVHPKSVCYRFSPNLSDRDEKTRGPKFHDVVKGEFCDGWLKVNVGEVGKGKAAKGKGKVAKGDGKGGTKSSRAAGQQHVGKLWPEEAFPWRPTPTAAALLARCCSRRVARGDAATLRRLLEEPVPASAFGIDGTWPSGAVICSLSGRPSSEALDIHVIAQLHEGLVVARVRRRVASHLLALLERLEDEVS